MTQGTKVQSKNLKVDLTISRHIKTDYYQGIDSTVVFMLSPKVN